MTIIYLILALIIAVLAVIFAWQNPGTMDIRFFSWSLEEAPQSLILLVTLLIGVLIGWLTAAPSLVKHTFRASGNRKRIGALEKELEDHKAKMGDAQKPAAPRPAEPKPVTPLPSTEKTDTDPLNHS